jgi:hypothetical protein
MDTNIPASPLPTEARVPKARFWQRRWVQTVVSAGVLSAVVAACAFGYMRATHFGQEVVASHLVDTRIEISNPPAYLDTRIVNALLEEAYQFAQKDEETYNRVRNTLDGEILGEFAKIYSGVQPATQSIEVSAGGMVKVQSVGFNAWIEEVPVVRREVARDKSVQTIQIFARWRQPAAWVRVGENLYLIDGAGVRLPGDYRRQDKGNNRMMVLTGVDLPAVAGRQPGVPAPGERWGAGKEGTMGEDLAAGLRLAGLLGRQEFAVQIEAIDMSNVNGRRDALAPWIKLETVWQTPTGTPRTVWWGRPIGQEKYYEVAAEAKVKTLRELNVGFGRIDAGHDFVDIRTEQVFMPKVAAGG